MEMYYYDRIISREKMRSSAIRKLLLSLVLICFGGFQCLSGILLLGMILLVFGGMLGGSAITTIVNMKDIDPRFHG